MQFRTEIQIPPVDFRFSRTKGIFTIGSCFAEVMGRKLTQVKANTLVNPFGTVFNPLSVHRLLRAAATEDHAFLEEGLVERQGIWFHQDFHSSFYHAQPADLLRRLEETLEQAHAFLQQAQALLLTWGTAYVYERKDTGAVVANCHKLPQNSFRKRLLSLEEVTQDAHQTLALLHTLFPALQVILTVSPVRHLKDTLALNSVSKSLLRLAAHQVQESAPQASYFPAYELLLDDLRDYRFYGSDLLHPSEMAEQYIWDKFINAYADNAFSSFLVRWEELQREVHHRSLHPESEAHQQFLRHLLTKLQNFALEADVQEELALVQSQILSP